MCKMRGRRSEEQFFPGEEREARRENGSNDRREKNGRKNEDPGGVIEIRGGEKETVLGDEIQFLKRPEEYHRKVLGGTNRPMGRVRKGSERCFKTAERKGGPQFE